MVLKMWLLMAAYYLLSICATTSVEGAINFDDLTGGCNDSLGFDCGEGVCVDGVCQCNPMWSTLTDFVELNECATSIIGIYVLWALNLVALIWTYYQSGAMIMLRFEMFFELRKTRGKSYTLCDNKGLLALLFYFGVSAPMHFVAVIIHFIDPTTRVAFDVLPTICFFFAKFGFYVCLFLVQSSMFGHVMKGMRNLGHLVPLNTTFQAILMVLSVANGAMPFVTLIVYQTNVGNQVQIMRAYYSIQTVTLFINAAGAFFLIRMVNKMFGAVKDISSGKSDEVRKKVNELQQSAMKTAGIQSVIYLIMAAVPFFINKHGYFLPISWLSMPVLGKILAFQFTGDRAAKPIMQRLGIKRTGDTSSAHDNTGGPNSKSGGQRNGAVQNATADTYGVTAVAASSMQDLGSFQVHSPLRSARKQHSENHPSSALSDGTYLDELMDPTHPHHVQFVKYIDDRHASNEIALFSSTLAYRNAASSKERTKLGKQIVHDFIEVDAPRGVDLPHEVRDIIISTAKRSQFVPTSFDDIRRTLVFELKGNFLGKFEELVAKPASAANIAKET